MSDTDEEEFAGEGQGPDPIEKTAERKDEAVDGESIAVPAGDLTGSITAALDELTEPDDDAAKEP